MNIYIVLYCQISVSPPKCLQAPVPLLVSSIKFVQQQMPIFYANRLQSVEVNIKLSAKLLKGQFTNDKPPPPFFYHFCPVLSVHADSFGFIHPDLEIYISDISAATSIQ